MRRLSSYIHRLTDEYIQCHHVSPAMYVRHLWDVKYRRTIFHVQVGPCGSHKNYVGTRYAELVFLHLVRSAVHIVYFVASRAWKVDALFFMLGWPPCGSHKTRIGTHHAELMFLHSVGYVGHVVHFGASGARNVNDIYLLVLIVLFVVAMKEYSTIIFLDIEEF
jgi:hypothetical protein